MFMFMFIIRERLLIYEHDQSDGLVHRDITDIYLRSRSRSLSRRGYQYMWMVKVMVMVKERLPIYVDGQGHGYGQAEVTDIYSWSWSQSCSRRSDPYMV